MKKFIYIIFCFVSFTSCVTSKQVIQKKNEREAKELIEYANKYINVPYLSGGTTAKGFDCSGYVQFVYKKIGYSLPRTTQEQSKIGEKVDKKNLEAGDLVFFKGKNSKSREIGHVGIVTKPNKKGKFEFIHAANTGVRMDDSETSYYKVRYVKARRIIGSR
ncbi:MAG: C40 family peptidase [Candidatus Azobacteroides sp.]|nr:C40 family peptidase [Candidatus Azobacteroides sp.]